MPEPDMVVDPIVKMLIWGAMRGVPLVVSWKRAWSPVVTREVVARPVFTYTLLEVAVSEEALTAAADTGCACRVIEKTIAQTLTSPIRIILLKARSDLEFIYLVVYHLEFVMFLFTAPRIEQRFYEICRNGVSHYFSRTLAPPGTFELVSYIRWILLYVRSMPELLNRA